MGELPLITGVLEDEHGGKGDVKGEQAPEVAVGSGFVDGRENLSVLHVVSDLTDSLREESCFHFIFFYFLESFGHNVVEIFWPS